MLKENDIIVARGVDYNSDGIGVAKYNNQTIFVNNLIIGEQAEIKIINVKRNFSLGKVVRFLEFSPDRIEPKIPETVYLGGCQFTQLRYEKELEHKTEKIERALRVIGGHDFKVSQITKAEEPYFYRNKTVLPLGMTKSGRVISGLYRFRTHEIVAMDQTHLDNLIVARILKVVKALIIKYNYTVYDEKAHSGMFRRVMVRTSHYTNDVLVVLITNDAKIVRFNEFVSELVREMPHISGVLQNINNRRTNVILGTEEKLWYGKPFIEEKLHGLTFQVSSKSFFQVNTRQAEVLYERALTLAKLNKNNVVLDAYSGTGTIALLASLKAKHVIGVEILKEAVKDAKLNAQRNNIDNVTFYEEDVSVFLKNNPAAKNIDTVIVDPPRKGLTTNFINDLISSNINKLVYISCNPATLARDLSLLLFNFQLMAIEAVDMFPRTSHVETVVILESK